MLLLLKNLKALPLPDSLAVGDAVVVRSLAASVRLVPYGI